MSDRLKNFISEREYTTYLGYMQEYLENYTNQNIAFYKANQKRTSKNDAFNEAELTNLDYDDPIMIPCFVKIESKNNQTYGNNESAKYEEYGNISVYILEQTIKELNLNFSYGDLIGYEIKNNYVFFELIDADVKNVSNDRTFGAYQSAFRIIIGTPTNESQIMFI